MYYKSLILSISILLFSFQGLFSKEKQINWISFEELQIKQKEEPKKVLISVYTSWCGWCKRMDKQVFTNASLIDFVNENYYAVRFDAETKDPIVFKGQEYNFVKEYKVNELAAVLLQGKMSYPTTIVMMENLSQVETFPGFLEVPLIESILKFFIENGKTNISWNEFEKSFESTWK